MMSDFWSGCHTRRGRPSVCRASHRLTRRWFRCNQARANNRQMNPQPPQPFAQRVVCYLPDAKAPPLVSRASRVLSHPIRPGCGGARPSALQLRPCPIPEPAFRLSLFEGRQAYDWAAIRRAMQPAAVLFQHELGSGHENVLGSIGQYGPGEPWFSDAGGLWLLWESRVPCRCPCLQAN